MSLSLMIFYKDSDREMTYQPFSFQRVLVQRWWPLALDLGLEQLERLETIHVTQKADAIGLVEEFRAAECHLRSTATHPEREYMLLRLGQVVRCIESALSEWHVVESLSL